MENPASLAMLLDGAKQLSVPLSDDVAHKLLRYGTELLRWNAKVNLTSVTTQEEVVEKHFLDSLAVLPEVSGAATLLDVGTGGGFPGIPLKLASPTLDVTLVETVGKKVGFLKHALAVLGVQNARGLQVRVSGDPGREGLSAYDCVISRAFTDVERWVPLAVPYLSANGWVVAMTGKAPDATVVANLAEKFGLKASQRSYTLPFSKDPRTAVVFRKV